MIRHRVANLCLIDHNLKNPNFLIFDRNLLKLSLTCFSHFSTPIKTNLISGWTFPLISMFASVIMVVLVRTDSRDFLRSPPPQS